MTAQGVTEGRAGTATSSPVRDLLALTQRPEVISFAGGLPAPELFDVAGLRAAFDAALSGPGARERLQYSVSEGDPELRVALAALFAQRGVPAAVDDLLVTTGSQQALALTFRTLLDPGDAVLVEEPTYLAALQAMRAHDLRPVGVACDDDGIVPEALAEAAESSGARLAYLVPTFQNPTGRTLPAARRAAVAEVVVDHGLTVVEDDPYGELRFRGRAPAPLASLDGMLDRTIAVSTLSKIVAPGMRIGWLRMPAPLRDALVVAKQAADLHTSTIDQAAAAHWLTHVDLDAHLARLRAGYAARHAALVAGLDACLPPGSEHNDPDGGMFCWVRLPDGHDATRSLSAALDRDVAFVPGAAFFAGAPDERTLRLSFAGETPERIAEGLGRLGAALAELGVSRA